MMRGRAVKPIRSNEWSREDAELRELQLACYRMARGLIAANRTIDTDDLGQEGVIAGWKHLRDGKPMGYAVVAAKGAMIDYLRSHGPQMRGGKSRAQAMDPTTIADVDLTPVPCEHTAVDNASERVWLLEQLKGREREVIERNVLGEETLAEIAATWGVTESRACQVKAKALAKMRNALDNALTGAFVEAGGTMSLEAWARAA